jgi:ectoine hydroxylase-related dioxygenase (phytanoyl-CoA dioxygenase family)
MEAGYLVREGVIAPCELERVQRDVDELLALGETGVGRRPMSRRNMAGNPHRPIIQIVNAWMASDPVLALLRRNDIAAAVAALAGEDVVRLLHDQVQCKPRRVGGANMWHQDGPFWPFLRDSSQITVWIPLDDATESSGCLWMVPGSHQWGACQAYLEHLDGFDGLPETYCTRPVEPVPIPMSVGSISFHHCLTWHGSGANREAWDRRALSGHYVVGATRLRGGVDDPLVRLAGLGDGEELGGPIFPLVHGAQARAKVHS